MDIDLNDEIEGIKLRYIRDALKKVRGHYVTAEDLTQRLGIPGGQGGRLVDALCRAGYLELADDTPASWPACYTTTMQGNALRMATMRRRINRSEAEAIVHKLRQRIPQAAERAKPSGATEPSPGPAAGAFFVLAHGCPAWAGGPAARLPVHDAGSCRR